MDIAAIFSSNAFIELLSVTFSLFVLMDSIGNVPIYLVILKDVPSKNQSRIIFRELLIALAVILFFMFLGDYLLAVLKVQLSTLQIAGGIILFMIAIKMIFPTLQGNTSVSKDELKDPLIVPLAIPLVAGPAVLAAVIIYAHSVTNLWILVFSILFAWLGSTIVLLGSTFLKNILGEKGLKACERLMGLILTLLATQMFLDGIHLFTKMVSSS